MNAMNLLFENNSIKPDFLEENTIMLDEASTVEYNRYNNMSIIESCIYFNAELAYNNSITESTIGYILEADETKKSFKDKVIEVFTNLKNLFIRIAGKVAGFFASLFKKKDKEVEEVKEEVEEKVKDLKGESKKTYEEVTPEVQAEVKEEIKAEIKSSPDVSATVKEEPQKPTNSEVPKDKEEEAKPKKTVKKLIKCNDKKIRILKAEAFDYLMNGNRDYVDKTLFSYIENKNQLDKLTDDYINECVAGSFIDKEELKVSAKGVSNIGKWLSDTLNVAEKNALSDKIDFGTLSIESVNKQVRELNEEYLHLKSRSAMYSKKFKTISDKFDELIKIYSKENSDNEEEIKLTKNAIAKANKISSAISSCTSVHVNYCSRAVGLINSELKRIPKLLDKYTVEVEV